MIRLALLLALAFPHRTVAQNIVAQAVGREAEEYVDGALANLALRTPIIAPGWRQPVVRGALFLTVNTVYETLIDPGRGQPGHPAWADWRNRALGYLATELLIETWRAVRR